MENSRDRVIRLYKQGRLSKEGLKAAVKNHIISAEDYRELTGEPYEEEE